MIDRRQRLEVALSLMPYNVQKVKFSKVQLHVEEIIARLRADESSSEEEVEDEATRQQRLEEEAIGFAERTMQQIEKSESSSLTTLATLTLVAKKLQNGTSDEEVLSIEDFEKDFNNCQIIDEETALAKTNHRRLLENNIKAINDAHMALFIRWEQNKRKALDLLTLEIAKVQNMEQSQEKPQPFEHFAEGTAELSASTPKTVEEDGADDEEEQQSKENAEEPIDDDDEDYVPNSGETNSNKRKRRSSIKKTATTGTAVPKGKRTCPEFEFDLDATSAMVTIGPNGTQVKRASLKAINWTTSGPAITRKLLCEIFDRATLAFHTLSGKPSPAFKECARPSKQQLDPSKVADLVYLMTRTLKMTPREVRTAITTKCADENKMLRTREQRKPRKTI